MKLLKHRAWPGVLALVCLLTGLITASPIPFMDRQVFADTGPDLTIESISWSPETPSIQDTITFTTTIKNQGDSLAPSSRIDYYIDDSLITSASVDTISTGKIVTNTFTWRVSTGDHIIKAIIDSENDIAETNEDNNEKICAFSVIAPDLIVDSVTWSPQTASLGDTVTFTVKLKNHGNKFANSGWVEFFIDNATQGQREYHRLEPNESTTVVYIWIAQAGNHTINAAADILNQVIESDETNNDLSVTYNTAPPDLIIYTILWSPTNRQDTDDVTVHVTVKNKGIGTAHPSWLDLYIDGALKLSVYIDSLDVGAVDTKSFTWIAGPNEHALLAVIDANNWIYESNESNNTNSIIMPAVTPPDLLVQSITWTPAQPTTNNWMTFTITVKNDGNKTVSECYFYFYADYTSKISRKLGPITPGSTASANILYLTSTIPINVRAIVDPANFVAESDETNNELVASLTPEPPTSTYDYYITSLTCTPQNPVAGQEVVITAKIKNNGSKQAPESFVAYYVDGIMVESVLIRKISARSTVTNTITWIATPGKHTIKVVADYNESLLEISETNNAKEIVVTTLSPDLAIESITWSPEIPVKGDTLTITFTIKNQGTYKSNGCYISYYVDGVYLGNHYIEEISTGETDTRTLPWTLTDDFQTFKVIIDEENSVIEGDETNNEKVAVIPAPDLLIESITYAPTEFPESGTVTFTIKVVNMGVTPAESPYLDCYINDVFQARLPVLSITAGASAEVFFDWTALAGQNVFKVIVDGADEIIEANEINNEISITLQTMVLVVESTPLPEEPVTEITENTTANETQEIASMIFDTDELPPAQDTGGISDIIANSDDDISELSDDSMQLWQNILGNKWLILGAAVLGLAVISVLLVMRKRSQAI